MEAQADLCTHESDSKKGADTSICTPRVGLQAIGEAEPWEDFGGCPTLVDSAWGASWDNGGFLADPPEIIAGDHQ